jgi:hypothetical protein
VSSPIWKRRTFELASVTRAVGSTTRSSPREDLGRRAAPVLSQPVQSVLCRPLGVPSRHVQSCDWRSSGPMRGGMVARSARSTESATTVAIVGQTWCGWSIRRVRVTGLSIAPSSTRSSRSSRRRMRGLRTVDPAHRFARCPAPNRVRTRRSAAPGVALELDTESVSDVYLVGVHLR